MTKELINFLKEQSLGLADDIEWMQDRIERKKGSKEKNLAEKAKYERIKNELDELIVRYES